MSSAPNPYASPRGSLAIGPAAIPDSAREPLRAAIRTLRIIVFALAAGVVIFGFFVVFQIAVKPVVLAGKLEPLNLILLGFGGLMLLLGAVLPPLLFHLRAQNPPAKVTWPAEAEPVMEIQSRIQTATIIGCALFEGGAFANLFGYMKTGELLHLILAALLVVGILARFPLPGACEAKIERELRRKSEQELLKLER
jgi:hypothetical protein